MAIKKKLWYVGMLIIVMLVAGCGSSTATGANANAGTTPISSSASSTTDFTPTAVMPTPSPTSVPTEPPTPTPTPAPTQQQETIVHNFTCLSGVYDAYKVPFDPGVLTIQFIQATTMGNTLTDYIYIKQVSNSMFLWKLYSKGEEVQDVINGYHFGVSVLGFTQSVVNPDGTFGTNQFPVAEVCSNWAGDGEKVFQG